jgi:two-component system heavy metal sensor histidine kinase CusS
LNLLRRVDIRLTFVLSAAMVAVLVVPMAILFFVASHEAIEQIDQAMEAELEQVAAELTTREPRAEQELPTPVGEAVRVRRADGIVETVLGHWPDHGQAYRTNAPALQISFAREGAYLVKERMGANGARLEISHPLDRFRKERREQLSQILLSMAIGSGIVVLVSLLATRSALRPLREATRAVESVDERHLDARIAARGTGDDVDRHAVALNRVIERLQRSFHRVQAFTADVAHELRTPVNRLVNLTDLALLDPKETEAAASLEQIKETADQMGRVIDALLLLARGDDGAIPAPSDRVELDALVRDAVDLFAPSAEAKDVALHLRTDGGSHAAIGHPDLLKRAVANLLDNAVRHTPEAASRSSSSDGPTAPRSASRTRARGSRARRPTASSSASCRSTPRGRRAARASGSRSCG